MAERIPDNADLAVDELRRKGRRRLVGAIVLALAAAVIVPMLLEKEPRPLGDDVSVQIPPVDEGKFVNRLTGKTSEPKLPARTNVRPEPGPATAEPKPEPKSELPKAEPIVGATPEAPQAAAATAPATAPNKSLTDAEQRVLSPTTKANDSGTPKAAVAPAAAPKTSAAAEAKPTVAKAETKVDPTPASAAAPAKADAFVVQLAAFADDKGANALANKLKKAGYTAYVEPVQTSRGTLWRVRVGGYASRAEADAARVKLKGEGHSGIVVAAK